MVRGNMRIWSLYLMKERSAYGWGHEGKKPSEKREETEEEGGNRQGDVNVKLEQRLQAEPST
jgi:hypothetical protein